MKRFLTEIAYGLGFLAFGGGIGTITYVVAYEVMREEALGAGPNVGYVCLVTAVGIGIFAASVLGWLVLHARVKPSDASRSQITDV